MNIFNIYTLIFIKYLMCVNCLSLNRSFTTGLHNMFKNFIGGKTPNILDHETPHISLKIKPATSLHLTRDELNMLLMEVKHEVTRQMSLLRDELSDKAKDSEKHLSSWSLNHAPVYIPYAHVEDAKSFNMKKNEKFDKTDLNKNLSEGQNEGKNHEMERVKT